MAVTHAPLELAALVDQLGRHPARALQLDLRAPQDTEAWFVAACLLAARRDEARALADFRALAQAGLTQPSRLTSADRARLAAVLEAARHPDAEAVAGRLVRAGARLAERGGSFEALAAEADDLEALGARLARLASGVGAATLLRFLRPLRERWPAAREVPLSPAARAAARHLGLLRESEDTQGEFAALRAALSRLGDPVAFADLEAALERLGRHACQRERPARCPLGARCPARHGPEAAPG